MSQFVPVYKCNAITKATNGHMMLVLHGLQLTCVTVAVSMAQIRLCSLCHDKIKTILSYLVKLKKDIVLDELFLFCNLLFIHS